MLWFAGFMGIFAAGTVAMVDFSGKTDDHVDLSEDTSEDPPFLLTADLLSAPIHTDPVDEPGAQSSENESTVEEFLANNSASQIDDAFHEDEDIETKEQSDDEITASHQLEPQNEHHLRDLIEFDPDEHDLIVVWDDALGTPPTIDLTSSLADDTITSISSEESHLANIRSDVDVSPEHIAIVPLSTAQALGWAEA